MTWWAAVLGFVGALAGSWGGQFIATRREDRRWERERDREDLRWQRERERLQDQLRHEMGVQWRERRLEVYSQLLSAITHFLKVGARLKEAELRAAGPGGPVNDQQYTRVDLQECAKGIRDLVNVVSLIASSRIQSACIIVDYEMARWLSEFCLSERGNPEVLTMEDLLGREEDLVKAHQALLNEMRTELGVDTSPSRPSGLTS
jgi:hypothetical protein